jgi:polyhydroxyalkanoate synthesis regulator phasin
MLDGVRKFVRERFEKISSRRPEDLARTLAQQGQATKKQATRITREVVEWSKKNRGVITEVVQREVRRQLARLGAATREEISALRRRVRDLEAGVGPTKASAKRAPAKKAAARKPAAKKTAATRSVSRKKSLAKETSARKTGAKKAPARKSARRAPPA